MEESVEVPYEQEHEAATLPTTTRTATTTANATFIEEQTKSESFIEQPTTSLISKKNNDDDDDNIHITVHDTEEQENITYISEQTTGKTPIPNDLSHLFTLMKRTFLTDKKRPRVVFLRTFVVCPLYMLYTLGFFLNSINNDDEDENSIVVGDYVLHGGEEWKYPKKWILGGNEGMEGLVQNISSILSSFFVDDVVVVDDVDKWGNISSFMLESCGNGLGGGTSSSRSSGYDFVDAGKEGICAYFSNSESYTIHYGGDEIASPFSDYLKGAQHALDASLVNVTTTSSSSNMYTATQIQQIPQLINNDDTGDGYGNYAAPLYAILVPGLTLAFASLIMMQFIMSPMTSEKINEIVRSYLLVGVKRRIYMFHWISYLAIWGVLTAVALTAVFVGWNIAGESSVVLIFISHYLALMQMYCMAPMITHVVEKEELVNGMPFLMAVMSLAVSCPLLVLVSESANVILSVLTVFSPFIGIINFGSIYSNYDKVGYDTGIHFNKNFVSSGLLGATIGQIVAVLMWIVIILIYCSPDHILFCSRGTKLDDDQEEEEEEEEEERSKKFEPLPSDADVLLSVKNLHHTYSSKCQCCSRGKSSSEPKKVLKGLNMDLCRGEVFGFLGHNGAGKTTTIRLLSGELSMNDGSGVVDYNFRDGKARLLGGGGGGKENGREIDIIRRRIGVCPQHDTVLHEEMTCRETLRLFAALKGRIPTTESHQSTSNAIEQTITTLLNDTIRFTSPLDADKPIRTLSGGMKRKLSIAIALLGDPEVVFLDEPTAGMDPYHRRQIWDMIGEVKKGRSVVLTTHFMDEADVLSDRVGILGKGGRMVACGSTLFLKYGLGVGYTLRYRPLMSKRDNDDDDNDEEEEDVVDVVGIVQREIGDDEVNVNALPTEGDVASGSLSHGFKLGHGTEPSFPKVLSALDDAGATNVSLELTTLEEVFIETGKDQDQQQQVDNGGEETLGSSSEEQEDNGDNDMIDLENPETKKDLLQKIWEPQEEIQQISFFRKMSHVQHFMMTNSLKEKGSFFLNLILPMTYFIGGMIAISLTDIESTVGQRVVPDPIEITPFIGGSQPTRFFGLPDMSSFGMSISPLIATDEPKDIDDYFEKDVPPIMSGYFIENQTLQFNPDQSPWALQIGEQIVTSYALAQNNNTNNSTNNNTNNNTNMIQTTLHQLPYNKTQSFRIDELILPIVLTYGFTGVAMSVLDILILKSNNIINLFRVAGISEWNAYLGVAWYKILTSFMPFFILVLALGRALSSVLVGNGGRWLGTILLNVAYAYACTPVGLLIARVFLKEKDIKSVRNWFPGMYLTFIGVPYVAWNLILQALIDNEKAYDTVYQLGDVLCLIPPVAFQRGIGAVIRISTKFDDEDLKWGEVWGWDNRVWFTVVIMLVVGTWEWWFLYKKTALSPPTTKLLSDEDKEAARPIDVSGDVDVQEERERSMIDDEGINARDLVKVFSAPPNKNSNNKKKQLKRAVKGLSFGVRKNEIYVLLGPNGAGKTVSMSVLSGQYTPEHGQIALDNRTTNTNANKNSTSHLYNRSNISYCPQFDALFAQKTVLEHLHFYSLLRGLPSTKSSQATTDHIQAITQLLGLQNHINTISTSLSGGYKRRLSLAVSMVGYPHCMMVDECTTGMDPRARHLVWGVLGRQSSSGEEEEEEGYYDIPAILLSTHYMDEASRLGTRIGIMIDGELVTTGTLDRLKDQYCNSYFVEIALEFGLDSEAKDKIIGMFEVEGNMKPELYESLPHRFKMQIPFMDGGVGGCTTTSQLASIFALLERYKVDLGIKFYSVRQMSLEQIFIDLSRKQFQQEEISERK